MSTNNKILSEGLNQTISNIELTGLGQKIKGKVRDCYVLGDKRVLISSDRLSAFDVLLTTIPYKGKLLNDLAMFWFEKTKHIINNHIISRPHPNVILAKEVKIIPIEVVVRGYLAGSAFRDYIAGKDISGVKLKSGLKKSEKFDQPILTPSTKAVYGEHDMPISEDEIITKKIVSIDTWECVKSAALSLFNFASSEVLKRGLILVDTKYEFGVLTKKNGSQEIVLADEVHTQDCSRYWISSTYQERFLKGEDPEMYDKEFVRRWLMDRGYMGEGPAPIIPDEFRIEIAERYIEAYEMITGEKFIFQNNPIDESIVNKILHQ